MKIIKKLVLIVCPLALLFSLLAACHTVEGAGKDIQAGGHAVSRAADRNS